MASIRIPKGWEIPERDATPEDVYLQRRRFMQGLGLLAIGATAACRQSDLMALGSDGEFANAATGEPMYNKGVPEDVLKLFPAKRNEKFKLDRNITPEKIRNVIQKQEAALRQKLGCDRVNFRVVVQDGKVKLKATPVS